MTENSLTAQGLADRLGSTSVRTVQKWMSGERRPRGEQIRKIAEITGGQVTFNDFFEQPASSESAA